MSGPLKVCVKTIIDVNEPIKTAVVETQPAALPFVIKQLIIKATNGKSTTESAW